jgi:hypothetical protein
MFGSAISRPGSASEKRAGKGGNPARFRSAGKAIRSPAPPYVFAAGNIRLIILAKNLICRLLTRRAARPPGECRKCRGRCGVHAPRHPARYRIKITGRTVRVRDRPEDTAEGSGAAPPFRAAPPSPSARGSLAAPVVGRCRADRLIIPARNLIGAAKADWLAYERLLEG